MYTYQFTYLFFKRLIYKRVTEKERERETNIWGKQKEKERERMNESFVYWFTPKISITFRLEDRKQKFHPDLPHKRQGPKSSGALLLSQSLYQEACWELENPEFNHPSSLRSWYPT